MRESGISASGVDLDLDMIPLCREKGPLLQAPGADVARFNEGIDRLDTLLFGFQEYAVIGQASLARPHETLPSSERES